MKRIFTLLVVALIALSAGKVSAQSLKFGHINFPELVQVMPELETARKSLEAYEKDLQAIMQDMQTNLQRLSKEIEDNPTWSEAIKNAKQKELNDLWKRMQEQASTSQQDYEKESQKLLEPIYAKAREAVKKVGKANGFTYVFDLTGNSILYFNEAQSTDILPLVKKELNIK